MMLFFFNDTATTEIYTLSLHDALPIYRDVVPQSRQHGCRGIDPRQPDRWRGAAGRLRQDHASPVDGGDRKSTRLNSSHANISYAVFCLKKNNIDDERELIAEGLDIPIV